MLLTRYFNTSKCEYLPLNTALLTLSSILLSSNCNAFGKHPLIQIVLKEMFKLKPSLPCFTVTYDAKHRLNYIRTNSASAEYLLELISQILVTLMGLRSVQRSQTLASLCRDIFLDGTNCAFCISKSLKTFCPRFHQHPLSSRLTQLKRLICSNDGQSICTEN